MTILGIKKQMTQMFDANSNAVAATIIDVADNAIVGKRTEEIDGYNAIILGFGKKKNFSKAEEGKYKGLGYVPMYVVEVRDAMLPEGSEINKPLAFDNTIENKQVHVTGMTKGKGFQGVVKRWGFHGGPKTHGQSDRHRSPGSIGSGTTPGRVYKGKKMGGRMGGDKQTVKNLDVLKYMPEENLIVVKGPIPGNKNSLVILNISE